MTIDRRDSQQTTCTALLDREGGQTQAAQASCTIRPGRGVYFSVDLLDGVSLTAEERQEIARLFAGYIAEQIAAAAATGVPVTLPTDD